MQQHESHGYNMKREEEQMAQCSV